MNWVSTREEASDPLVTDFAIRPPMASPSDFSPIPTEWHLHHDIRNPRHDLRYEFSLAAAREFDTDSVNAMDNTDTFDDDNASTDLQTNSASEDTSVGVDTSYMKDVLHPEDSVPALLSTPSDSQLQPAVHKSAKPPTPSASKDRPKRTPAARVAAPATTTAKPVKSIQKKRTTQTRQASKTASLPGTSSQSLYGPNSTPQSGALSHTKMCRDRLNSMFERLRSTLPPAPSGVEVKHKAQVLDYAIAVLKSMVDRTAQLEVELAVSSNKATMDWISKLVNDVDSFVEAAEQVMKLFSRRRGWQHAELWMASRRNCEPDVDLEEAVILKFGRAVPIDSTVTASLELDNFSTESQSYTFRAKEGVQGRVWSSMRPEWVTGLGDVKNFRRASLARKFGVKVCLAVPVTITGKIEAVMCFYDTKHRTYDLQCVELAMRLAWALGNAIGGKRAKQGDLSTSGSSSM